MARKFEDEPKALGPIVEGVFRDSKQGPALTLNRLRQHWAGIVGEPLARATYPTRLARGVLWVAAPDSGWAFNLQFVKADVLNGVRTFLGSGTVKEVRFKVGEPPEDGQGWHSGVSAGAGNPGDSPHAKPVTQPGPLDPPNQATIGGQQPPRTGLQSLLGLFRKAGKQAGGPDETHLESPDDSPVSGTEIPNVPGANPAGAAPADPAGPEEAAVEGNPLTRTIARMASKESQEPK